MAIAERLNGAQQENLVSILAHDPINGKLVAQMAKPELFEGEYRTIAERCIDYWGRFKKAPGVHTADLFGEILDDPNNRKRKTYERILRNMQQLYETVNTEYVLRTLSEFTRVQRMKGAILRAAETLNAQQEAGISEVEELLADLLRAREIGFEPGMRLSNPTRILDWLDVHYSEFTTGVRELDRKNIVPARGAVMLWLAPTGRGKTWGLINLGKQGVLRRKKTLHITLEMGEEEVGQRYYQSLFALPKRSEEFEIATLTQDDDGKVDTFDRETIEPELAFDDGKIRERLRATIKPWKKRIDEVLIVKRFPPRSLTLNGLRAYLDGLEATEGFIPDQLILDYIGIMSTDEKNHRISLGRVMEGFRAICVERNMAGVTAHQTSKVSAEAELVKATHVAEDWSLIGTSDIAVTYTQTEAEKRLGLARLFVAKARSEEDQFGVILTQSYKSGQFVLQSAMLDRDYYDYLKEQRKEYEKNDRDDDEDSDDDR